MPKSVYMIGKKLEFHSCSCVFLSWQCGSRDGKMGWLVDHFRQNIQHTSTSKYLMDSCYPQNKAD